MDPKKSAEYIIDNSTEVHVDKAGVLSAANLLLAEIKLHKRLDRSNITKDPPLTPTNLSDEEMLEWLFVLDTVNFCFWSDTDVLFTVGYCGKHWTGYMALRAGFLKALEAGVPVHKPSFYTSITHDQLADILKSVTDISVPLLDERVSALREAGTVLMQTFGGEVCELIKQSGQSAKKLLELLVENFTSYKDEAVYKSQKVAFLKRAQIFAANVWDSFHGRGYGTFHDIGVLTMFADYRVPQSLQYLGVLKYSNALFEKLKKGEHLEQGSQNECEIRGCSIHAVELIRNQLGALIVEDSELDTGLMPNAVQIDFFLWTYAKSNREAMASFPIHKTLSIFY